MQKGLRISKTLMKHVMTALHEANGDKPLFSKGLVESDATSSVLFLLGERCCEPASSEPCIIFNKRSKHVKQPGDLCFPGGRISLPFDFCGAKIITLPFMPLARWIPWTHWKQFRRHESRDLALLLATGLRESFEEMRLNPWMVDFLGPLPPENLPMFSRVLYPMVVWVHQKHFLPNWEVEKVVPVPLRKLLDSRNYACCRISFGLDRRTGLDRGSQNFPCFRYLGEEEQVLWGATYRIVMVFLEMVFQFKAPEMSTLPMISRVLDERYLHGSAAQEG